jgi:hypothetical protein
MPPQGQTQVPVSFVIVNGKRIPVSNSDPNASGGIPDFDPNEFVQDFDPNEFAAGQQTPTIPQQNPYYQSPFEFGPSEEPTPQQQAPPPQSYYESPFAVKPFQFGDQRPQPEAPDPWYHPDRLIPTGLRVAGGVTGGIMGGAAGSIVPGAGTIGGIALGGGVGSYLGDAAAQGYEYLRGDRPEGYDVRSGLVEGGLGAIPLMGKAPGLTAPAKEWFRHAATAPIKGAAEGALLGAGGVTAHSVFEQGHLPTWEEFKSGAKGGAAFGAVTAGAFSSVPSVRRGRAAQTRATAAKEATGYRNWKTGEILNEVETPNFAATAADLPPIRPKGAIELKVGDQTNLVIALQKLREATHDATTEELLSQLRMRGHSPETAILEPHNSVENIIADELQSRGVTADAEPPAVDINKQQSPSSRIQATNDEFDRLLGEAGFSPALAARMSLEERDTITQHMRGWTDYGATPEAAKAVFDKYGVPYREPLPPQSLSGGIEIDPSNPQELDFLSQQLNQQAPQLEFVDPNTGEIRTGEPQPGDIPITPDPAAQQAQQAAPELEQPQQRRATKRIGSMELGPSPAGDMPVRPEGTELPIQPEQVLPDPGDNFTDWIKNLARGEEGTFDPTFGGKFGKRGVASFDAPMEGGLPKLQTPRHIEGEKYIDFIRRYLYSEESPFFEKKTQWNPGTRTDLTNTEIIERFNQLPPEVRNGANEMWKEVQAKGSRPAAGIVDIAKRFIKEEEGSVSHTAAIARLRELFMKQRNTNLTPEELTEAVTLSKEVAAKPDTPKLPESLRGAKPRFNTGTNFYLPQFASDLDKALYIVAQPHPSKQDAQYLKFVMDNTGLDEAAARELGGKVRQQVRKAVDKHANAGGGSGAVEIPIIASQTPSVPQSESGGIPSSGNVDAAAPPSTATGGAGGIPPIIPPVITGGTGEGGGQNIPPPGPPNPPGSVPLPPNQPPQGPDPRQPGGVMPQLGPTRRPVLGPELPGTGGINSGRTQPAVPWDTAAPVPPAQPAGVLPQLGPTRLPQQGPRRPRQPYVDNNPQLVQDLQQRIRTALEKQNLNVGPGDINKLMASFEQVIRENPNMDTSGIIRQVLGANKALLTSWDLSAPGRQGKAFLLNSEFWKALPGMVKAWGSKGAADAIEQAIRDHPSGYFKQGINPKGKPTKSFAELAGLELSQTEEMFSKVGGQAFEKYSGIGKSSRAHTAFLNKLRSDMFAKFMEQAKAAGRNPEVDLELAKTFATYINNATGRGSVNIGKWKLERMTGVMNDVFFAPKNLSGQIRTWNQVLNPVKYATMDPVLRKQSLKSLFAIAGAGMMTAEISRELGAKVSHDPTSTDFMKIKVGDTRIDLFGGYQQFPVAAMTAMLGQKTMAAGRNAGRTVDLTAGRFGQPTRKSEAEKFFKNRLSPVGSFIYSWMDGREFDGKPFEVKRALYERAMPIVLKDLTELAQEDPAMAAVLSPLLVSGMASTQVYTGR